MRRRGWAVAAAAVLAATLLAGCASESGGQWGLAPSDSADLDLGAGWVDGGRMIAVTTWGSSSCVPVAESAELNGGVLAVTLTDAAGGESPAACTMDNVQRATIVGLPAGVDPSQDLSLEVQYTATAGAASGSGKITLAGVAGLAVPSGETDYLPSAGWVGDDGTFALVTWGSSSCAPQVSDVQESSATEVTVSFADPPADRVCTMDIAPRATLAVAPGLAGVEAAEVVLQGDTFAGERAPILG